MKHRDMLLALMVLLVLWQAASMLVNNPILPSPWVVAQVFVEELGSGLLCIFLPACGG